MKNNDAFTQAIRIRDNGILRDVLEKSHRIPTEAIGAIIILMDKGIAAMERE